MHAHTYIHTNIQYLSSYNIYIYVKYNIHTYTSFWQTHLILWFLSIEANPTECFPPGKRQGDSAIPSQCGMIEANSFGWNVMIYPLVNVYITMGNNHFLWVNQLFLWPFSIAMFVYQRVDIKLGKFHHDRTLFSRALESWLGFGESPGYSRYSV